MTGLRVFRRRPVEYPTVEQARAKAIEMSNAGEPAALCARHPEQRAAYIAFWTERLLEMELEEFEDYA